MERLPIVYIRGYAGATAGIDAATDDPFLGFNLGSTHVRVDGDGDPMYYQYEGPMLRLITEHGYELLVRGDQRRILTDPDAQVPPNTIWVHRFYDSAATTFGPKPREGLLDRAKEWLHDRVSSDGFEIEQAAADLYVLVEQVLGRTGAPKVNLVAHSMGGLVARCMMQKLCGEPSARGEEPRKAAKDIVAKLFTFGTPHGGIATDMAAINKAMELFGPASSQVFAPPVMYSYLTPGVDFGDTHDVPDDFDPRRIPSTIFDTTDVFCLVGTDPVDYGPSKHVVGPRSDGLVRIENAYVKGAHRAFVYKSHSGRYGEVNSEEGYQNLRRFLFARWGVTAEFDGIERLEAGDVSWQADMRLAIRGLPIVMSEQLAAHWCPIILSQEARTHTDNPNAPVPVVSTFLFHPEPADPDRPSGEAGQYSRYVLTLRVYQIVQKRGFFDFRDHIEQVSDWVDSLIIDVGPTDDGKIGGFYGWNALTDGPIASTARMPQPLDLVDDGTGRRVARVPLPESARALPIFSDTAALLVSVRDREHPTP